jgi:CubicO group peptidase (beta-lactamase class C family)
MRTIVDLSGAAIISRAGSTVFETASGVADADLGARCTTQTRFQLASVSKQFAAVAVMRLVESGLVELTASIEPWLDVCPPAWRSITLHHLLSQTSGMAHWGTAAGFDPSVALSTTERIAGFIQAPLLSAPGERWSYSSPGFIVIGQIVERASGMPYADFLTEQIVGPLGLTSTTVADPPGNEHRALGYRDGVPMPIWDLNTMAGTGDIWSTVGDLARFTAGVHSGLLLTSGSKAALRTPYTALAGDGSPDDEWLRGDGYSYGHYVGSIGGLAAVFHPGDNPGYLAFAAWLPDTDTCIAVLVNDEALDLVGLIRQLVTIADE